MYCCILICFLRLEESLIKCIGYRCLSCALRSNVSIRRASALSLCIVHQTNPLNICLIRMSLRNALHAKINIRKILFAFMMSISVLFQIHHYFLCRFLNVTSRAILLAFRMPSLSPYKKIWLLQKRNVTHKWHRMLFRSKLHSWSANLEQRGIEESFYDFMFLYFSILQILN